jgi:hypothetical protein
MTPVGYVSPVPTRVTMNMERAIVTRLTTHHTTLCHNPRLLKLLQQNQVMSYDNSRQKTNVLMDYNWKV